MIFAALLRRCARESREQRVYPDGSKQEFDTAECMADQAAGHRSFRLLRAQMGKDASGPDAEALDYCHRNWIESDGKNDWHMANFCARQQYTAHVFLGALQEGR